MKEKGSVFLALFAICMIAIAAVVFSLNSDYNKNINNQSDSLTTSPKFESSNIGEVNLTDQEKDYKITWDKSEKVDPMTDKVTKYASLRSQDYVNLRFPYEGDTYMTMTIRQKGGQTDIYLVIDRGQIQCNEYSGTDFVNVRFDDENPIKFRTAEAASGDSEIVFISGNINKFINKCKKAKNIKVQIPIYHYGQALFTFYVTDPLQWP